MCESAPCCERECSSQPPSMRAAQLLRGCSKCRIRDMMLRTPSTTDTAHVTDPPLFTHRHDQRRRVICVDVLYGAQSAAHDTALCLRRGVSANRRRCGADRRSSSFAWCGGYRPQRGLMRERIPPATRSVRHYRCRLYLSPPTAARPVPSMPPDVARRDKRRALSAFTLMRGGAHAPRYAADGDAMPYCATRVRRSFFMPVC